MKSQKKDISLDFEHSHCQSPIIALAGNPNVGKSTIFNALTGLKQHTGNWPGKTVANASGICKYKDVDFLFTDIPGTYSLMSNSVEEEIARNFICFGKPDAVVVVVNATCLELNLNLVSQILEITKKVVICVNFLDEAKKKKIRIDLDEISLQFGGVPVIGTTARSKKGLTELMDAIYSISFNKKNIYDVPLKYECAIETALSLIEPSVNKIVGDKVNSRWLSLKLLDTDDTLNNSLSSYLGFDISRFPTIKWCLEEAHNFLTDRGYSKELIRDSIVSAIIKRSEHIYKYSVFIGYKNYNNIDRKLDKLLTSKLTGIPIMLLLLGIIFWITLVGSNYPSAFLSDFFGEIENKLTILFIDIEAPSWLHGILVLGMYRTVAWVISVMLPPMAIFFPLFTLLEDSGYLPRIAFNMDNFFKKAGAHGKQALTTCMGFGCNACGVIGCRIIDSPRERLIAILTNNFVPCNGRLPPHHKGQLNQLMQKG